MYAPAGRTPGRSTRSQVDRFRQVLKEPDKHPSRDHEETVALIWEVALAPKARGWERVLEWLIRKLESVGSPS